MRALLLAPVLLSLACAANATHDEELSLASTGNPIVHPSSRNAVRYDRDAVFADRAEIRATVKSLGYRKAVGVRASIDGGAWTDWTGAFESTANPTRKLETWTTTIRASFRRIEYAIFYRDLETGAVHWDNNGGKNFELLSDALVHRVGDAVADQKLTIELEVKNAAYDKSCWASATSNGWLGSSMPAGRYVGPGDRPGFERWRVEIPLDDHGITNALAVDAAAYEYAVVCRVGGADGWDSNRGQNFRWERVAPPVVAWSIPFDGGQRVVVSESGTTFVLSGGRWVSGYSADGRWLFAQDAGGEVADMFWSAAAGLVVRAEGRFRAFGVDGVVRWTTEQDYTLIAAHTRDGDYLVGPRGGAMLGASAPKLLAPAGGCAIGDHPYETYPALSARGVMFCKSGDGVVRVDLRAGTLGGKLALAGLPWAASEDVFVLVSADRSSLRAYRHDGTALWKKDGLSVSGDTAYGYGQACATHASGDLAVLFQTPGAYTPDGVYYAGLELSTGKERFRKVTSDIGYGPCAQLDGRFYVMHSPYKYGTTMDRISPDGSVKALNVGNGATLLGFAADGKVARRSWAYYPNDRGRLVVHDGAGNEVFARTYWTTESLAHAVATAGDRLALVEPGKLTHLRFE